jgi:hypothetical protein
MQEVILYKDVLELGFQRKEQNDSVFFNQYGFNYYLMNKKLDKKITAEWDINKRTVRIIRCNKHGDVLGQINVNNLNELKMYIKFFKNNGVAFSSITKTKEEIVVKEKLEQIISEIGEKEFLKLMKVLGYKLVDPNKFFNREKTKSEKIGKTDY